ncbi:YceI family protein [Streptomyces sp. T028]|uniref:YceI family protein n=1 Tax=Streptomyces sp. T028 TaxID=3394379 RepID=UPI003A89FD70
MTATTTLGELTGDYVLDPAHSRIGFAARAAMVAKVRGRFDAFEGRVRLDGDTPSKSTARLTIRAQSIQTRNRKRDDHLRGGDFLDSDHHPAITFTSTRVRQTGGTTFQVTGDLDLRGVTRPVTVDVELTDSGDDARGGFRVDFTGSATINRRDWTVNGAGGLVGDKVTLRFDIAAIRQS